MSEFEKLSFSPGYCENLKCRKFAFFRTDWVAITRGVGRGHGYALCRACSKSEQIRIVIHEHEDKFALIQILEYPFADREKITRDFASNSHHCQFCEPCPTHHY